MAFSKNMKFLVCLLCISYFSQANAQYLEERWLIGSDGNTASSYMVDFSGTEPKFTKSKLNSQCCSQFLLNDCSGAQRMIYLHHSTLLKGKYHSFFTNDSSVMKGDTNFSENFNTSNAIYPVVGFLYPGSKDSFVLLSTYSNKTKSFFGFVVVNLIANNKKGEVLDSVYSIRNNINYWELAVIPHLNKKDYWIITLKNKDTAEVFLFNSAGISQNSVLSPGYFPTGILPGYSFPSDWEPFHNIIGTFDGKFVVMGGYSYLNHSNALICRYDFDAGTGKLSNPKIIMQQNNVPQADHAAMDIAISLNDSFAYFGTRPITGYWKTGAKGYFYQLNIRTNEKTLLMQHQSLKFQLQEFAGFYNTRLAPDGRIYTTSNVRKNASDSINKILRVNSPNSRGFRSNFRFWKPDSWFQSYSYQNKQTLIHPFSRPSFECNTATNICRDTVMFNLKADTWWNNAILCFGDGDTFKFNYSNSKLNTIKHKYAASGKYEVKQFSWFKKCSGFRLYLDTIEVHLPPKPIVAEIKQFVDCGSDSVSIFVKSKGAKSWTIHWTHPTTELDHKFMDTSTDSLRVGKRYYGIGNNLLKIFTSNELCSAEFLDTLNLGIRQFPNVKIINYNPHICNGGTLLFADTLGVDSCNISIFVNGIKDTSFYGILENYSKSIWHNGSLDSIVNLEFEFVTKQNCSKKIYQQVIVHPSYKFNILEKEQFGCLGSSVKIKHQFKDTINLYKFGYAMAKDSFFIHSLPPMHFKESLNRIKLFANKKFDNLFCSSHDTIILKLSNPLKIIFLKSDTAICKEQGNFVNWSIRKIGEIQTILNYNQSSYIVKDTFKSIKLDSIGEIIIKLIAIDSFGCKDSLTKKVVVFPNPKPLVSFSPHSGVQCYETPVFQIKDTTKGVNEWKIKTPYIKNGDSFRFLNNGLIPITLVKSLGYCKDSISFQLKILDSLTGYIIPDTACLNKSLPINLITNRPKDSISKIVWITSNKDTFTNYIETGMLSKSGHQNLLTAEFKDVNGCTGKSQIRLVILDTASIFISLIPWVITEPLQFKFQIQPKTLIPQGKFIWRINGVKVNENQTFQHGFLSDTQWQNIILEYTDRNGCKSYSDTSVRILGKTGFYIPNIFTPNNKDGINDVFKINGPQYIKELKMKIYNRWGAKIAELNAPTDVWEGQNSINGLYIYTGYMRDIYNRYIELNGTIILE